ncbi:hypothetical protein OROMI_004129 [Orobanche minor]
MHLFSLSRFPFRLHLSKPSPMASSSSSISDPNLLVNGFDPNSVPNTTFVQADPSTFRDVVQLLTSAVPAKTAGKLFCGEISTRGSAIKLHERWPTARRLEIELGGTANINGCGHLHSPPKARNSRGENMVMVSPVSPLEYLEAAVARGSPRTPRSPMEEEERAIAGKGFYLHPSPLSTPRGSEPPELLPLFPLCSPKDN